MKLQQSLRHAVALTAVLGSFAALAPACSGKVGTLCSKICDCQHCNDADDENTCTELSAQQDVSKDYGCDSQFTDYIQCQIDKGRCDDKNARWTTSSPGSCSSSFETGEMCMTVADCHGGQNPQCTNMKCTLKACSGQGMQPCNSDSDCQNGTDLCEAQLTVLDKCVAAASTDPTVLGGNNTQTP